ncbi:hypothetical protein ACLX1H_000144 [Fusarium chlamydosporum]
MGYSEVLCHICGVSFNIRRFRTDKEPSTEALDTPFYLNAENCPEEGGCFFVRRGSDLQPPAEPVKYSPSEIEYSDIQEDDQEHIPGPNCGQSGAYNGHRITMEAMKHCQTLQCLVYKPADWQPQPDDEEFEVSGHYFLSGLSDHMPSRDESSPTVFPARHGLDNPNAENTMWDIDDADSYAMPFHPTCLEIFKRASLRRHGVVDVECLTQWWRLEATYEELFDFPRVDAVRNGQQQWWEHNLGDEYLVANPCFVPGLESVLQSAQGMNHAEKDGSKSTTTTISTKSTSNDLFSKLPAEIRDSILVQLDFKDLANLRLSSRVFLELPNPVLYELTLRHTPWLYEAWSSLPLSFWTTTTQEKLEREYDDTSAFERASHSATPVNRLNRTGTNWLHLQAEISRNWNKFLGLKNRRRIWDDCEEILDRVDKYRQQGKIAAWA